MQPSGDSGQARRKFKLGPAYHPSHTGMAAHAIIIFTKAPIPGQVKTRLCPPLSADEAASLHGSLVMDVLERCKTLSGFDRYVACTPTVDHPFFKTMAARYGVQLWNQVGHDLGERMDQALTAALNKTHRNALVIGTDIPTLSAQTCILAVRALENHDVVFGPTPDGGYYLVGLKRPVPELFRDIPWSTPSVLSESLKKAHGLGLSVGQLEQLHDIDTLEDLAFMVTQLQGQPKKKFSTRTANVLLALGQRHLSKK